ncbi:hypothetical protein [Clostridium vitabionis]|uniref:hypothetical protein n=1 Tax=Clostridium vitabionis TaxID=2784388 RepID=UPI00188C8CD7|nr:hypothetical protein [Clostridium vitabionis]
MDLYFIQMSNFILQSAENINDVKKHYRLADADWRIKGVFIVNEPQVSKDIYKHEIDIISKSELSLARVKQVIDSTN